MGPEEEVEWRTDAGQGFTELKGRQSAFIIELLCLVVFDEV